MQAQKKRAAPRREPKSSPSYNTTDCISRTPRARHLVNHLCDCGHRPVFEALLAVEAGQEASP